MELPGSNGMLHNITLGFHKLCYVNDTVTITCKIIQKVEALKVIVLDIQIRRENTLLVSGQAQVGVSE